MSPLGILLCLAIVALAIFMAQRPGLPARRLIGGYLGALAVFAVFVAVRTYCPRDAALAQWNVTPEHYLAALGEHFYTNFMVFGYWSLIGMSVIGLPLLVAFAANNRATAPWLIGASAVVALLLAVVLELVFGFGPLAEFIVLLWILVPPCCLMTAGFVAGARLRWA